MTDDERTIRDVVETWMAATKRGDLATVLSLMTDDVVFMVPGQEPFGKEAFSALSDGMRSIEIDGTSNVQELQIVVAWAYMRNHTFASRRRQQAAANLFGAQATRYRSSAKVRTVDGVSRGMPTC